MWTLSIIALVLVSAFSISLGKQNHTYGKLKLTGQKISNNPQKLDGGDDSNGKWILPETDSDEDHWNKQVVEKFSLGKALEQSPYEDLDTRLLHCPPGSIGN